MREQRWFCERCGAYGTTRYAAGSTSPEICALVHRDHALASPECEGAFLRVLSDRPCGWRGPSRSRA